MHKKPSDIQAYMYATETEHYVCSACPDSESTQRAVRLLEGKRVIDALNNYTEYKQKILRLTICDDCITKLESPLSPQKPHGRIY